MYILLTPRYLHCLKAQHRIIHHTRLAMLAKKRAGIAGIANYAAHVYVDEAEEEILATFGGGGGPVPHVINEQMDPGVSRLFPGLVLPIKGE